ncbi:unnamed protein product, partial [Effrenium voratum]
MNSPKSDRGDVSRLRLSFSSRRSSPGRRSSPSRRRASPREKKEEVKVVVRLRPPMEQMNQLAYFVEADPTKLLGYSQEESGRSSPSRACVEELQFSRVVGPEEDTLQMYSVLGLKGLIGGITDGFQETVFAYGQTGSGKTHTILGSPQELGLLQLCAKELFAAVFATGAEEKHRRVQLVCLEIKNDEVLNLLPEGNATASQEADIFCHKGRRYGYQRVTVWSYEETMVLLQQAIASREVGSSYVNSESSRSHMLVRFLVKTLRAEHGQLAEGVVGSLTLVDLAGNERESGTNGTAINVSLTHLNRMLVKMQDRQLDEWEPQICQGVLWLEVLSIAGNELCSVKLPRASTLQSIKEEISRAVNCNVTGSDLLCFNDETWEVPSMQPLQPIDASRVEVTWVKKEGFLIGDQLFYCGPGLALNSLVQRGARCQVKSGDTFHNYFNVFFPESRCTLAVHRQHLVRMRPGEQRLPPGLQVGDVFYYTGPPRKGQGNALLPAGACGEVVEPGLL